MYRLDSHIHCQYSPDSSTKIDDIIKKSIEDKIDIIAISDHNTVEGSKVAVKKTKNTENLLVIPSIEISSSKGHILGFGCEVEYAIVLNVFEARGFDVKQFHVLYLRAYIIHDKTKINKYFV